MPRIGSAGLGSTGIDRAGLGSAGFDRNVLGWIGLGSAGLGWNGLRSVGTARLGWVQFYNLGPGRAELVDPSCAELGPAGS